MKTKTLFALAILLLLVNSAEAARVAVVVDLQNQSYTKCITVSDNANAYEVLEKAGLDISWSYYGDSLGHGLCGINGLGCPAESCYCDISRYWGFYVKEKNRDDWTYSQVGFDGGTSCSEHYCARDGDMIGLSYGEFGTKPSDYEYKDICGSRKAKDDSYLLELGPWNPETGDTVTLRVFDNQTKEGIARVETSVFHGGSKIFFGVTDENGAIRFTLNKTGQYLVKINVFRYDSPQKTIKLNVTEKTTTTTTTATTSSTSTTTTTTTLATQSTTTTSATTLIFTTTSVTTTTTETTSTTEAGRNILIGDVTAAQATNNRAILLISALVIALAIAYSGRKIYQAKIDNKGSAEETKEENK